EFLVHFLYQPSVRLHHHLRVARLHAKDYLVVIFISRYAQKLHSAFHHTDGGIAIAAHDAVAERTMIGADAHGGAILFANLNQWCEPLADAIDFFGVLRVGVFYEV